MKRNKAFVTGFTGRGMWVLSMFLFFALLAATANASVSPLVLPDNRAWEQVSPVDKNGTDVSEGGAMAAVDGNRVLYQAQGPFAGAGTSLATDRLPYMATRTPSGWSTVSLMPPGGTFSFGWNGYQGFMPDLSKGAIAWTENQITGTVDPEAPYGFNLYMRDTASGSFQLLNGTLNPVGNGHGFVQGSSDFSKIAIGSSKPLTPDSPCTGSGFCAYEWEEGELRLASIVNGEPVEGSVGTWPGGGGNSEHALSNDGRRLFFLGSPTTNGGAGLNLYVREDGTTTTLLSGSERTLPGGASGFRFVYHSAEAAHGHRVLFATRNSLLDADSDETNDLYLYDFTRPEGERLTLISEDRNPDAPAGASVEGNATETAGVLAASEDLRRVYFAAANQIVAGEPNEPGPKVYLWDDTGASPEVRHIATLDVEDGQAWAGLSIFSYRGGPKRETRWSSDGRFLVFTSIAKLTDFDNEGRREIYRYDAVADSLQCASCSPDTFPSDDELFHPLDAEIGFDVPFFYAKPINRQLHNVSESGQVFFQTNRGLVPRDSNGKFDVYTYEDGQLHLISAGTGEDNSFFLDASPSGSDVFFATRDRLVGWDNDASVDVYDARVNGGLPEPPPPPPPCEGDSCQPPPAVPVDPSLASASFVGPPDPSARKPRRRCRAGKVRRGGKCRKKANRQKRANKQRSVR